MRHSGENMLVFTCYSVETLLRFGGSQSWVCNPKRAAAAQYLICTRNCHHKMADELSGHGDGFLIARISQIIPAFYFPGRWLIGFDAYAEIYCPSLWTGAQNPVAYQPTTACEIDVDRLHFHPAPEPDLDYIQAFMTAENTACMQGEG